MDSAILISASSRTLSICIAFACPMSAWALDAIPDNTPYISDPSFLPRQGEIYSETTYAYSTRDQDWQPSGGAVDEHYSANSNSYIEQVEYGITNRLSVGGQGSYADTAEHYNYSFRSATDADTNRFNNPTFNLTYRAINQLESPVSVYVEALFAPGIVDNAPHSAGVDLYVNRELSFPTAQGHIGLTIQGELGTSYDDAYTTNNPLSGIASDITGYWSYLFAARSQLRLTHRWAINSGVVYSRDLSNSVISPGVGDAYVAAPTTTVAPYAALVFGIVPNRVNLALEYHYEFIGDDHHSGASSGTWIDQSQSVYEMDLFLRF